VHLTRSNKTREFYVRVFAGTKCSQSLFSSVSLSRTLNLYKIILIVKS